MSLKKVIVDNLEYKYLTELEIMPQARVILKGDPIFDDINSHITYDVIVYDDGTFNIMEETVFPSYYDVDLDYKHYAEGQAHWKDGKISVSDVNHKHREELLIELTNDFILEFQSKLKNGLEEFYSKKPLFEKLTSSLEETKIIAQAFQVFFGYFGFKSQQFLAEYKKTYEQSVGIKYENHALNVIYKLHEKGLLT